MAARRPSSAVAVSLVLHLVLGAGLVRLVMDPGSFAWMLPRTPAEPPQEERVRYVAVRPAGGESAPRAGRAGGDGERERPGAERSAPRLAAPTTAPAGIPAARPSPSAPTDEPGGTGPLVGGGGPLRGVQPRYGDGRVWRRPDDVAPEPKTDEQRLDSAFAVRFKQHQDSMAVLAGMRKPGDWTVTRADGSKWGVEGPSADGRVRIPTLRLGRISIPLPVGLPVRPGQPERERALRAITSDVAEQSTRRLTEDEFRKAVKQIRERKEWERSRRDGGAKDQVADAPATAPTSAVPER